MTVRIAEAAAAVPKTGPGNKYKRRRLAEIRDYLLKRFDHMNYHWLREADLEIASGSGEGAVNHLVAIRFDNGGMRWIKERAQPLLQLRCVDQNGDWDSSTCNVDARGVAGHHEGSTGRQPRHRPLARRGAPWPRSSRDRASPDPRCGQPNEAASFQASKQRSRAGFSKLSIRPVPAEGPADGLADFPETLPPGSPQKAPDPLDITPV